jgi:hypothetical protein
MHHSVQTLMQWSLIYCKLIRAWYGQDKGPHDQIWDRKIAFWTIWVLSKNVDTPPVSRGDVSLVQMKYLEGYNIQTYNIYIINIIYIYTFLR